jgi:hypothetical protein
VSEPRDIVDIDGLRPASPGSASARPGSTSARPGSASARDPAERHGPAKPFLMIWFRCCAAYGRLNKTPDGLFYEGRCPKCLAHLEVPVGEGGTNRRMFEAQ